MPKTTFQRIVFTLLGVLLMATTMATFNKYLVYSKFMDNPFVEAKFYQQIGIAFLQKAPLAFILQFFIVQKLAAKGAAKFPTENKMVGRAIRVGFTATIMAPIMCIYSNIINWITMDGWTFAKFCQSVLEKLPVNWLFAFFIQVIVLKPLLELLFKLIFRKQLEKGDAPKTKPQEEKAE